MSIVVFWVVKPCDLVGDYKCFGGTYRLRLPGVTTQNNKISIFTVMRTSNLRSDKLPTTQVHVG
jgi:hypothetical protein